MLPSLPLDLEKELVTIALEFRAAAPWQELDNGDYLLVDEGAAGIRALSILGAGRQQYGLQSFAASCASEWLGMVEQPDIWDDMDPSVPLELLEGEMLELTKKAETWTEDRVRLERAGYTPPPRARQAWPVFRAMRPGTFPWHVDETAARRLLADLRRSLRWAELAPSLPTDCRAFGRPIGERELATVSAELPTDRTWQPADITWQPLSPPRPREVEALPTGIEDDATAQLPQRTDVWWWLDERGQLMRVQAGRDEQPYFPRLAVCLDGPTGLSYAPVMLPATEPFGRASQKVLTQTLTALGFRPGEIRTPIPQLARALGAWARALRVKITVAEPDERLMHFWWAMEQMPR